MNCKRLVLFLMNDDKEAQVREESTQPEQVVRITPVLGLGAVSIRKKA